MDIGMIVIHLAGGGAVVCRCEKERAGMRLTPAANAAELAAQAALALADQGVTLDEAGLYLCPDDLQLAAQLPPLTLPADSITFGAARALLYPEASSNTGWQRVHRDVKAGRLRVWRVGIGQDTRQYVSRAEVLGLVERRAAETTA